MPKTKIIDLSKRMSVFACSISLLYFLGGCASNFTGEPISLKLGGLGKPRVLMMQTQVIRGKDSYSMDMIVDVSKERLTVVGSSLGLRVFTLSYDGTRVAEGFGLGLPFYIPNRLVVDDVTLILTSREILKDSLPAGCSNILRLATTSSNVPMLPRASSLILVPLTPGDGPSASMSKSVPILPRAS